MGRICSQCRAQLRLMGVYPQVPSGACWVSEPLVGEHLPRLALVEA